MIDEQTAKPIRCEGCGFAFKFAESGGKCAVNCPACGDKNALTQCLCTVCPETEETLLGIVPCIEPVNDDVIKCRAKNCPRLKGACGGCFSETITPNVVLPNTASPISKQSSEQKRHLILFLTVCVQIFVLLGTTAYVLSNYHKMTKTNHQSARIAVKERPQAVPFTPVPATKAPAVSVPAVAVSAPIKPIPPVVNPVKETVPLLPITQTETKPPATVVKPAEKTAATAKPEAAKPVDKPIAKPKPELAKLEPAKPEVVKVEVPNPKTNPVPPAVTAPSKLTETTMIAPKKDNIPNSVPPAVLNVPPNAPASIPVNITVNTPSSPTPASISDKTPIEAPQKVTPESMLEGSTAFLASDPERSLKDILNAIKTFEQLGRSIPSVTYWMLGQAYASLSWGKMFLINSSPVENITISSDSHWMLTQREDNSVWIWDIFRNQMNRSGIQLDSGKIPYIKLVFSPDLRLIIGGRSDGMILIWNMAQQHSPEIPIPLREKITGLRDLQISPDSCWLAAFGGTSKSPIAAVRNKRYVHAVESPFPVENVFLENVLENVLEKGKYFRGLDEPIPPYQIVRLHSMVSTKKNVENAKISNEIPLEIPSKAILLEPSFPAHKNIQVSYFSEYVSARPEAETEQLPIKVAAMEAVSTLSEPNVVWLWDLRQIHNGFIPPPIILQGHDDEIHLMQFSPDSGKLAVGGKNSTTFVYDLHENKAEKTPKVLRGHRLDVTAFAFAPDGRWMATGSRDNTIRLWNLTDLKSNPEPVVLNGHLGWISSLFIDVTGTKLFSGSYDKTIRIWNIDPNNITAAAKHSPLVIQSNQGVIQELALSSDGKKLISLGGDGSLRILNIDGTIDERHSMTFRNRMLPISKIALTPNNRWLVFSYTNQRNPSNSGVRLWPLSLDHLIQLISE